MFPPQTLVSPRMTRAVLVPNPIVNSIMSSVQTGVYAIVPTRTIVPVSSRTSAVPTAVAGIMAINKLVTFTVALVAVATLTLVALISESCPR